MCRGDVEVIICAAVARRLSAAATSRFDWGVERPDVRATNQGWPQSVDAEGELMAASGLDSFGRFTGDLLRSDAGLLRSLNRPTTSRSCLL